MHNIMDKLAVLVDNQYWDLFSSEVPKKNLRSLNIEADVERTGLWSAPWEKLSMGTKTPSSVPGFVGHYAYRRVDLFTAQRL